MGTSLNDIEDMSITELANHAGSLNPDSNSSAGASFLRYVRDEVVGTWQNTDDPSNYDFSDEVITIGDRAPDHDTHHMWEEFVDLGAYRESCETADEWQGDFDDMGNRALYQIAYRLASYLFQELKDWCEEEEDEEEEDEAGYPLNDEW